MAALLKQKKNKAKKDDIEEIGVQDAETGKITESMDKPERKKGKKGLIVAILLFLALIGFIFAVFKFNVFDIRDHYLRGFLEKIPIVNNILPPLEAENSVLSQSKEELLDTINGLNAEIAVLNAEIDNLSAMNNIYSRQVESLSEFDERQRQFNEDKEEFDRRIASGDTSAYAEYYSQVSEGNAERIYAEIVEEATRAQELKDYVKTYQEMDETSAAKVFEEMVKTDTDLVVIILKNINAEHRASIIAAMTPASAVIVTRQMAPDTP